MCSFTTTVNEQVISLLVDTLFAKWSFERWVQRVFGFKRFSRWFAFLDTSSHRSLPSSCDELVRPMGLPRMLQRFYLLTKRAWRSQNRVEPMQDWLGLSLPHSKQAAVVAPEVKQAVDFFGRAIVAKALTASQEAGKLRVLFLPARRRSWPLSMRYSCTSRTTPAKED